MLFLHTRRLVVQMYVCLRGTKYLDIFLCLRAHGKPAEEEAINKLVVTPSGVASHGLFSLYEAWAGDVSLTAVVRAPPRRKTQRRWWSDPRNGLCVFGHPTYLLDISSTLGKSWIRHHRLLVGTGAPRPCSFIMRWVQPSHCSLISN